MTKPFNKFKDVLWTSKDQNYETPQWVWYRLNEYYGFTTDPCTTKENPLGCKVFFTPENNGLDWKKWQGKVFINPPYSRDTQHLWVKEAIRYFKETGNTVVMLLPSRTEVRLYQDIIYKNMSFINFIGKRLQFNNSENSAPFGSAIVVFTKKPTLEEISIHNSFGTVLKKY